MSVFLVVSFDFCGDSNVALHILTVNQEEADTMYEHLYKKYDKVNTKYGDTGYQHMVELVQVSLGFGADMNLTHTFFWGNEINENVVVLRSNSMDVRAQRA